MLMTLLSSASGNGGSEAVATLARTNRTLRGPLRAPSASLSEPAFGRQQGGYNLPTREIFFTHTSKEQVLTRVGSCAVSSAAKVNPDWQVTVFSNGLTNPKQKLGTRQQWAGSFALFPSWSGHNPPRVVRFEYERIFRDTPFENWYKQKRVWSVDSPPRTCRTHSASRCSTNLAGRTLTLT